MAGATSMRERCFAALSMSKTRNHIQDLRGASRLVVDATKGVTDLVEAMHRAIGGGPAVLGRPLDVPTGLLIAPVYGSIRAVTGIVGAGIDSALAELAPLIGERDVRPEHETALAVLNGVLGDYLCETKNALAIEMAFRHDRRRLVLEKEPLRAALPGAGGKLLVLVHGSCMNDLLWSRQGHDHGAALARDLGYTPIYLHYNSGLHISTNGRALAARLEELVAAWPAPIDQLVILAHSMGGLVARSACHYGEAAKHAWRRTLAKLVCLGTPHHGAPLERGGNWVEFLLAISRYSAPFARLARIRSAGVTDLRFGSVLDEHWHGRGRFALEVDRRTALPLPEGVACYAIAGTTARGPARTLASDGMVPVASALGQCPRPELTLAFPEANRWIAFGTGHLDLLDRPEVYAKIASWLGD
jgi:pimeloyl-ACP methyl ester carboxylesterase